MLNYSIQRLILGQPPNIINDSNPEVDLNSSFNSPWVKINLADDDSLVPIYSKRHISAIAGINPTKDVIFQRNADCAERIFVDSNGDIKKASTGGRRILSTRGLNTLFSSNWDVMSKLVLKEKEFYIGEGAIFDGQMNPILIVYIRMRDFKKILSLLYPGYRRSSLIMASMNHVELMSNCVNEIVVEAAIDYATNVDKVPVPLKNWINKFFQIINDPSTTKVTINLVNEFTNQDLGIVYDKVVDEIVNNSNSESDLYSTGDSIKAMGDYIFNTHEFYNIEELRELFSQSRTQSLFAENLDANSTNFATIIARRLRERNTV